MSRKLPNNRELASEFSVTSITIRKAIQALEQEIGAWFEVVQPQAEEAGIPWRGRYPWDWHGHVGFSVGYTPTEREALADVFMENFKAIFGQYPRTVGSWYIDAHLLGYLSDRYGIVASCNCKDQWGTDGYTLWGGYQGAAYYPSRKNAFTPAQTTEAQIPVPVFRMLGSDPIYQYEAQCGENGQPVITLEPVCKIGGGDPNWVRWFFDMLQQGSFLLMDGFRWSSDSVQAGIRPVRILSDGTVQPLSGTTPSVQESDQNAIRISWPIEVGNIFEITCNEHELKFHSTAENWALEISYGLGRSCVNSISANTIAYTYEGQSYGVDCHCEKSENVNNGKQCYLFPLNGEIACILHANAIIP